MRKFVNISKVKESIYTIKINREEKGNALNEDLVTDIYNAVTDIESLNDAKVILLCGGEKFFSAGVDISMIANTTYEKSLNNKFMDEKWTYLERISIPVISIVEGIAFGGGFELSLMSDMIISGENAKFAFPEVNLGLMPGLGGTRKLSDLIGFQKAFEIITTGKTITAEEAEDLGIVSYIDNNPFKKGLEIADQIATKSLTAIQSIKKMFQIMKRRLYMEDITFERQLFTSLFSTNDKEKLTQKFLSNR